MTYTEKNPSIEYVKNIEYYKEMHANGINLSSGTYKSKEKTYNGKTTSYYAKTIKNIIDKNKYQSLLEFGCGKGQYYKKKFKIKNETIPPLNNYWNLKINLFDPCVKKYHKFPNENIDISICIDVLEHIPEEDHDWILEKFLSITNFFSFIQVACYPAIALLPNGKNAHISIKDHNYWQDKLIKITKINPNIKIICLCVYKDDKGRFPFHEIGINDKLENYL